MSIPIFSHVGANLTVPGRIASRVFIRGGGGLMHFLRRTTSRALALLLSTQLLLISCPGDVHVLSTRLRDKETKKLFATVGATAL
jgi:hypothetical protein